MQTYTLQIKMNFPIYEKDQYHISGLSEADAIKARDNIWLRGYPVNVGPKMIVVLSPFQIKEVALIIEP